MSESQRTNWTTAAIFLCCGILIGGSITFVGMSSSHMQSRKANAEIAAGTLASLRLATLRTLRDEAVDDDSDAVDNALAELEGGLQGDLELLGKIKAPNPTTEVLLRQIREYQKEHPLPEPRGNSEAANGSGAEQ